MFQHFRSLEERRRSNGSKEGGVLLSDGGMSRKRERQSSGTLNSALNRNLSPKVRQQIRHIGKVFDTIFKKSCTFQHALCCYVEERFKQSL